jgi:GT2 family glycosyltransferase
MGAHVDVVVVSYNSAATLRRCVEPLAAGEAVRVFVVDNASQDGGVETLGGLDVTIIRLEENRGFGHGCNYGWRAGSAPHVLFLNPDAVLEPGSLELLVDALDEDTSVGIAAPRIFDADGQLDFSMRRFPRLRSTYAQALFLHRLFPHATWTDEVVRRPDLYVLPASPEWVSGACFLIRRSLLDALGGFDDGFFMYSEDSDLCHRAAVAGWRISFVPEAVVVHLGGASASRSSLFPVLATSRWRYVRKNENRVVSSLARGGLLLGEFTHTLVSRGGIASRRGHARAFFALLRPPPEEPKDRPSSGTSQRESST